MGNGMLSHRAGGNDAFRAVLGHGLSGMLVCTQGVHALPEEERVELLRLVAGFNVFNEDNDPYNEHDFGAIELHGQKFFWKFDYYNGDYSAGAEDGEPMKRVLTVMLAEEY